MKQVPMEDYGQASLIKGFHNNRTNSFVIGKQVENSEQEEQDERQPEWKHKSVSATHFM